MTTLDLRQMVGTGTDAETTSQVASAEADHIPERGAKPDLLSVIVPVFNEQDTVPLLVPRLMETLGALGMDFEIVFVDDGSTDNTRFMLDSVVVTDRRIGAVQFSRNFGHQAAVTAGLLFARGDVICVMDADLQDPPELLPSMLDKWREGFDVVYATRSVRADTWLKRVLARLYYRFLGQVSDIKIPIDAADFCLMDRRVVDVLNTLPERNRYVRGLRAWAGFRQSSVSFARPARAAGDAKYSTLRSLRLGVDGVLSFSKAPLRLATWIGLATSALSFALLIFILFQKLAGVTVQGWTSTIVTVLFIGGVQLLSIGIMGEYLSRIYDEVKQRPTFVVADLLGVVADARRASAPITYQRAQR